MIKRLSCFFAAVLLFTSAVTAAVPAHTTQFYINDFANVLSAETENLIFNKSKSYADSSQIQVVVTTVTTLDGRTVEDYSLEMARSWGIGDKEDNTGVLILVSTGDREIRVEVGYGLEGILNDSKVGRLIRNEAVPYLSKNDYDSGIKELYLAVMNEIGDVTAQTAKDVESEDSTCLAGIIVFLIVVVLISGLFGGRGGRGGRGRGGFGGWYFPGPGGFGRGGFGGGGFGGGSSGGFSGGGFGGGFGGGGASGKF